MPIEVALMVVMITGGAYVMIAVVVFFWMRARSQSAKMQAETQQRLIDRFTSAPELVSFLQSPEGQKFVNGIEAVPKYTSRERIVATVRRSIIIGILGIACLALNIPWETRSEVWMAAGVILLALGLAFGISAVVSMKMSKSMGLLAD